MDEEERGDNRTQATTWRQHATHTENSTNPAWVPAQDTRTAQHAFVCACVCVCVQACFGCLPTKESQYLTQIKHPQKRQTLTKYGLSDHKLAIETGRYKREWLERAKRICVHCETGEVETETHFLINCPKYKEIREELFPKFKEKIPDLLTLQQDKIIQIFLGEDSSTVALAGEYVCAGHNLRNVSM